MYGPICYYQFEYVWSYVYVQYIYIWICLSLVAQMLKSPPMMQESQVWSLSQKDPLEEGMATDSSILAWRIQWTEEPGGLLSTGSQRVGHNWSDWACMCVYVLIKSFDIFCQILAGFLLYSTIMPLPRRPLCGRVVMFTLGRSDIHCFVFSL